MLVLISGCSDSTRVRVPWPPFGPNVISTVVGIEEDDQLVWAEAFDSNDSLLARPIDPEATLTLWALGFDRPLASLDLVAGPITPAPASEGSKTTLGAQAPVARLTRAGRDEEAEWKTAESNNPLDALSHQVPSLPCAFLPENVRRIEIRESAPPGFVGVLDSDNLLLGLVGHTAYHLRRAGQPTPVELPESAIFDQMAIRDPGDPPGPLTLATRSKLWKATLEGGTVRFEELAVLDPPSRFLGLLTSRGMIYGVTTRGTFEEFDGSEWRTLHDFEISETSTVTHASLGVTGDGDVLAVVGSSKDLVMWDGRELSIEQDLELSTAPTAVGWTESLGVIVGDGLGLVSHRTAGAFERMSETGAHVKINAIAATDHGFVFVGDDGFVGEYTEGDSSQGSLRSPRFCPLLQPSAANLFQALQFGRSIVTRGKIATGDHPIEVFVLDPTE